MCVRARTCVHVCIIEAYFRLPGFRIPFWISCWPRRRAAGKQTEKILIHCPQLWARFPSVAAATIVMAPHSKCQCCSTETAGSGDSETLSNSRSGRGRKVLSGDWGRDPSGPWMAFRVLDKTHPSLPTGIPRLPSPLEALQCYLTHFWSPTWWQAAKSTSPEPESPHPQFLRSMNPIYVPWHSPSVKAMRNCPVLKMHY